MNDLSHLVDDNAAPFFAPASSDIISTLLGKYQQQRGYIDHIASIATGDMGGAIDWFLSGNRDHCRWIPDMEKLFKRDGAIAALNSRYWSDGMALTDVYKAMPQARRDAWNKNIREMTTPEFTKEAVYSTFNDLLSLRPAFLAERVDGIFQGLSGLHVTNVPEGFSRRMIIANVVGSFFHSTSRAGLINDLRAVIATYMCRDEPNQSATGAVITMASSRPGEWIELDGGAFRIRCYKIGTAHIEVHPDMAYRLNMELARLHPRAIPAQFRTKPKKVAKQFLMMGRPLPFAVLEVIRELRRVRGTNSFALGYYKKGSTVREEVIRVLVGIGGVINRHNGLSMDFGYDPQEAMNEIIASGCIPDRVAHQYFPTPEVVARAAVALAQIGSGDAVLEPSAGQGGIADYFPIKENSLCVEISKLHCDILRAKGFETVHADFMEWAARAPKFERVVMNPPFSDGRAKAHLVFASELVIPGGRLVAILPESMRGKDLLPGWIIEWSHVYENEFAGTSTNVVIMSGVRP